MANKTWVNLIQSGATRASGVIYPSGIADWGDGWYQAFQKRLMEREDNKKEEVRATETLER